MVLELVKAAALLLALSLLQGLIVRYWQHNVTLRRLLSGCLFGGICVVGMMTPIELMPGVIFDPRSVILSMAGLFGGGIVAAIAAAVAGGYRLWLGGGGVYVGLAVVGMCAVLGLTYRHAHSRGWVDIRASRLLAFGFLVHILVVGLFTQLPDSAVDEVMGTVALPLILTFAPATAFLGLLLQDIENRLKIESDLVQSQARLSLHLENTPLAAITWDKNFRCVQWNKAAEKIFGYTRDEAVGRHAVGLVLDAPTEMKLRDTFQALIDGSGGERKVNENITKDGRTIVCEWYNTTIRDENGETFGVVSLAEDVTDQKQAQDEIKFKNTLLITQQEASADGMLSVDADGHVISLNRRFIAMWGIPSEVAESGSDDRLLDAVLKKLVDPGQFLERVRHLYANRHETSIDEIDLTDGRVFERHSAPMTGADGLYYGRMWMFRDITARKRSDELIWNQANFDALTGLPNRQMLRDRLEHEIVNAHRSGGKVALLYLDLDQFKDINDTLGHSVGDGLLKEAADRLVACVRETDTVARLGGDEFTIVMGGLEDVGSIERVASGVLQSFSEPFQLAEEAVYVTTSIGITLYPDDAGEVDEMLKNGDQAMYAAKEQGRNCYQYFTSSMQQQAVRRAQMIKDLRLALPDGQFQLWYQPIVEMSTGRIQKAEALLRWMHPTRGLISPAEFVPLAEETRMIVDIGDWVFREAVRQCDVWRSTFHPGFQVTINTSPVQYLSDSVAVSDWIRYLQEVELAGSAVAVEITEGLLMEFSDKVSDKLLMFRDAGIQVSLDDFGTGYSSLSYLMKFDIDYLKIDQSFVRNLKADSDDMALCEAIIIMAHKLGLKVVGEGIETQSQRDLLAAAGCDYGQGYFYSRPLSVDALDDLLAASEEVWDSAACQMGA